MSQERASLENFTLISIYGKDLFSGPPYLHFGLIHQSIGDLAILQGCFNFIFIEVWKLGSLTLKFILVWSPVEACWAHNPEVHGSKPQSATNRQETNL